MRTFRVSDVEVSGKQLEAVAVESAVARQLTAPRDMVAELRGDHREPAPPTIEACGVNQDHLVRAAGRDDDEIDGVHPVLAALHTAFAEHLPLVLSPDDVWLCLAQGFAIHVQVHAEALRERFVRHAGALTLQVRRDEFLRGDPGNDWQGCFAEWSDAIASHIGKKRDLVVAAFSTTGPIERAASELVLMSAMRSYFDFQAVTMCGIPEITLLGTVDDWRAIRQRAELFAEFDLADWGQALRPVLDQFVAAAEGRVDRAFWQSIYKLSSQSGGPYVTGWINALFPYRQDGLDAEAEGDDRFAPKLQRNDEAYTWWRSTEVEAGTRARRRVSADAFRGPRLGAFPRGLCQAPLTWKYLGTELAMTLSGGFVGIAQDPATFAVRPAIGWAVSDAER